MQRWHVTQRGVVCLLILALGCAPPQSVGGQDEKEITETFAAFQGALKKRDADKLWELFDVESQVAAERAGKVIKLSGMDFLKSDSFYQDPYNEIAESKLNRVAVEGDKATAFYTEDDGDKKQLRFVREGGKWKVSGPMP